jgi:high-affinity Fe2+/Pb2+ permease
MPFVAIIFCAGWLLYMYLNDIPIGGYPGPIAGMAFLVAISLIYSIFDYFDEKGDKKKRK